MNDFADIEPRKQAVSREFLAREDVERNKCDVDLEERREDIENKKGNGILDVGEK